MVQTNNNEQVIPTQAATAEQTPSPVGVDERTADQRASDTNHEETLKQLKLENERMERNLAELKRQSNVKAMGGGSQAGSIPKTPQQIIDEKDERLVNKAIHGYFGKPK